MYFRAQSLQKVLRYLAAYVKTGWRPGPFLEKQGCLNRNSCTVIELMQPTRNHSFSQYNLRYINQYNLQYNSMNEMRGAKNGTIVFSDNPVWVCFPAKPTIYCYFLNSSLSLLVTRFLCCASKHASVECYIIL